MQLLRFLAAALAASVVKADDYSSRPRYVMYYDQYHTTLLPNQTLTAGITHAITAFANSSLFASEPARPYTPFEALDTVRARFDNGTKICMAIGGWADLDGFGLGSTNDTTRRRFAKNVADTIARLGYDCVGKTVDIWLQQKMS